MTQSSSFREQVAAAGRLGSEHSIQDGGIGTPQQGINGTDGALALQPLNWTDSVPSEGG